MGPARREVPESAMAWQFFPGPGRKQVRVASMGAGSRDTHPPRSSSRPPRPRHPARTPADTAEDGDWRQRPESREAQQSQRVANPVGLVGEGDPVDWSCVVRGVGAAERELPVLIHSVPN
eukprot:3787521-Rhodomonas_salina.1